MKNEKPIRQLAEKISQESGKWRRQELKMSS